MSRLTIQKLFKKKYLKIQAKLALPLAATILLLVILSPLTNQINNARIEQEADRRLAGIADSVGTLIENSEVVARNNAALLASQPEVTGVFQNNTSNNRLLQIKEDLLLQELSLYSADFKNGDRTLFYGGTTDVQLLQISEDALLIREGLILSALAEKGPVSGISISPQGSQIIGAAPVYNPQTNELVGVILTAFYMDDAYIENISAIINTDIAIVKDNAVVVSTIDESAGYEKLVNEDWLDSAELPALNVKSSDGKEYRMLSHPLIISGNRQGIVLVTQPVDELFSRNRSIQLILFSVTALFALTALWLWIATFLTVTRPLVQLIEATSGISQGDFNRQVNPSHFLFKDEITVLSENFNAMTSELNELRTSLEHRVEQRTQELGEARDATVSANNSKSKFVSIVSHELKLPLTSIKGYSDLMLAGATGQLNENQTSFLTTIRNNANRMATLVSDLVDTSRIESGNIRLEPRVILVWDAINEVVTLMKKQIEQKKQTISVDIPNELPRTWCDRTRLAQIMTNLISNANKYTPEDGMIVVQAIQVEDLIQIKVQDNGLGMTLEDQKNLFRNFFRSVDDKVRESPGTGLGLSITKKLIELQGGRIWFESEFRKGTTFFFTVPVYQEQDKK